MIDSQFLVDIQTPYPGFGWLPRYPGKRFRFQSMPIHSEGVRSLHTVLPMGGGSSEQCTTSHSRPTEVFHRKEWERKRMPSGLGCRRRASPPIRQPNPAPSRCRAGRPTYIRALAQRRRVTGRPRSTSTVNYAYYATSLSPIPQSVALRHTWRKRYFFPRRGLSRWENSDSRGRWFLHHDDVSATFQGMLHHAAAG